MRDLLFSDDPFQPQDAYVSARQGMGRKLPKRFYKEASVVARDGAFAIELDGKPALTPARKPLAVRTRAAAEVIAAEWNGRAETIDPLEMPATRMANIGIDRVSEVREAVIDDIAKYAASDLTCYRAADPVELVEMETRVWEPVLAHMRDVHRAPFILSQGIGFADQSPQSLATVRQAVAAIADPVALAAFHTLTTIAGSVLIALAFADGAMDAEAAFAASSVEEDWNARLWGMDAEAALRRERRHRDFLAAAELFQALV